MPLQLSILVPHRQVLCQFDEARLGETKFLSINRYLASNGIFRIRFIGGTYHI